MIVGLAVGAAVGGAILLFCVLHFLFPMRKQPARINLGRGVNDTAPTSKRIRYHLISLTEHISIQKLYFNIQYLFLLIIPTVTGTVLLIEQTQYLLPCLPLISDYHLKRVRNQLMGIWHRHQSIHTIMAI